MKVVVVVLSWTWNSYTKDDLGYDQILRFRVKCVR